MFYFCFWIYIKRKVKIVVKLMTSEHSDSDDNCDELSELRNRREFETQQSVDVSSSFNCDESDDNSFRRRPSTWMTCCQLLESLESIRNCWFLVFACLLAYPVAFVPLISSSWPTPPKTIGVACQSWSTWISSSAKIWPSPLKW